MAGKKFQGKGRPQLCLQELRGRADEKGMVGVEGAGRKKLGMIWGFPSLLTLLGS